MTKRCGWVWVVAVVALGAVCVGCGDSHEEDGGAGDTSAGDTSAGDTNAGDTNAGDTNAGDTSAGDTNAGDTATSDTGPGSGPCPGSLPEASGSCSREGLVCEYGPRTCLATAECNGGTWTVSTPRCPPPPAGGCPATREDAQGAACPGDEGAPCEYDGLICRCTSCPDPYPVCMIVDPPVWACEAPNPDPSCPPAQPLLGTGCTMDAQVCDYGCEAGERRVCVGGGWTADSAPGGCPMSTRRVKRSIDYLDAEDVDVIARDVFATRLATYEYTDPALADGRHLGFIIEDQPHAYSVDPERSQVDLYGYTSMLVAAVQAQQRQIEALELHVRALESQDRSCSPSSSPRP